MPYASVSDVRNLAPFVPINSASTPSEGTVETFIRDVESTLNTMLRAIGYTVPLVALPGKSTTDALAILRQMVSNAVMARVLRGRPNPETNPEAFQREYDAILKALRDPDDVFALPDVETTIDDVKALQSQMRVSSNLTDDLNYPARVTRDQIF